jgi:hypothetical protein
MRCQPVRHAASRGASVRSGIRQSMPSSSIDSCTGESVTAAAVGLRPREAASLQALGQQQQALTVEPQHLEDAASAAVEGEPMAAERIGCQRRLHDDCQSVEVFPDARMTGA